MTPDDLIAKKGQEIGVSCWFHIHQDSIDQFGTLTYDRQFIHVDPLAAKETPFGGTIAHGFLTLSFFTAMLSSIVKEFQGVEFAVNYGFDRVRFLAPVPSGSRVRGRFSISNIEERGNNQLLVKYAVSVEAESHSTPVLVADWLGLYARKDEGDGGRGNTI